jgi:hypothetical protein
LGEKNESTKFMAGNEVSIWGGDAVATSEFLKNRGDQFEESYNVDIITIDSFVKDAGLDRVDFIKIDTEGFEKEIIRGASETIKKFFPIIACSAYHLKNDKVDIPKLVLSINPNYKYRLETRGEEDFIFIPKNKS